MQRDDRYPNPYQGMNRAEAVFLYQTAPLSERKRVHDAMDHGQMCKAFIGPTTCFERHSGIKTYEAGAEPEFVCLTCGQHWSAPRDH